ncbi:arabinofuranosidase [Bimuria novae-zelandiae CBS 107.79]|uniref:Arabinofuranosidase n=1 Tax=Bimuria novae-zelandiae CBS 107.79 TaxID=1447943 RepID=A0A6A5VCN8_9PLEO|nr:arabinofuranosidase [Bimuria novae-zelandiae CBS 107.79]
MHFFKTLTSLALGLSTLVTAATYTNPLKAKNGSDPHIVWSGGYYYLMTTTWTNLQITRATTINGLKTGQTKTVYSQSSGARSGNPELHWLDNAWYLYFTAGNGKDLGTQRSHVLKGGATPWDTFSFATTLTNFWSIDGTIMNSPTSIGASKLLSQPTLSWETVDTPVNEGPSAMYHGGKTYITYSASFCWTTSYSLGLLTWNGSGDPSLSSSWSKSGPVLKSENGNYGPGHNGFFTSPDGTEISNVYHATANSAAACDGNRYTMVNKMNWNSNGTPNFGTPAKLGTSFTGPSGE